MDFWSSFITNLLEGIVNTLKILSISIPFSIALGFLLGFIKLYSNRILALLAEAITALFRGLPAIVTLMIIFFGLADFKIYLSPFWAATLGFILCGSSYISEYVRGAIRSIDVGQSEAAKALGMNKMQEQLYIILPQTIRRALPGVSNEITYMIQYSSLSFIVGVKDIFSVAITFNSLYFYSIEIFICVALIYLLLIAIANIIFRVIEIKLRYPK